MPWLTWPPSPHLALLATAHRPVCTPSPHFATTRLATPHHASPRLASPRHTSPPSATAPPCRPPRRRARA
eukprot:7219826-Prymnesium_polylepis.1